jgi:hypothetical protein
MTEFALVTVVICVALAAAHARSVRQLQEQNTRLEQLVGDVNGRSCQHPGRSLRVDGFWDARIAAGSCTLCGNSIVLSVRPDFSQRIYALVVGEVAPAEFIPVSTAMPTTNDVHVA